MSETQATQTEPEGVPARPIISFAVGFLIFVAACLATFSPIRILRLPNVARRCFG